MSFENLETSSWSSKVHEGIAELPSNLKNSWELFYQTTGKGSIGSDLGNIKNSSEEGCHGSLRNDFLKKFECILWWRWDESSRKNVQILSFIKDSNDFRKTLICLPERFEFSLGIESCRISMNIWWSFWTASGDFCLDKIYRIFWSKIHSFVANLKILSQKIWTIFLRGFRVLLNKICVIFWRISIQDDLKVLLEKII